MRDPQTESGSGASPPAIDLAGVVQQVPWLLSVWDRQMRCRFANLAYESWFGAPADSLCGVHLQDLLGEASFAIVRARVEAALAGQTQSFERDLPVADGTVRRVNVTYVPDRVGTAVVGFIALVTETTRLREIEDALRREKQEREKAEQYVRRLDALVREREEMLDVLAHEVRQPLHNAMAALASASGSLTQAESSAAAQPLLRARDMIGEVVADVDNSLAVAVLLARQHPIARVDTDIDTLLAVAIGDMPAAQRDRIVVERNCLTRTASMDMSLMRLALRNLLSNALKFSPPHSPVVVRVLDSDEPLALLIEVADAGAGIEAELVPGLFERGVRTASHGAPPGHGLGLYIVRRIMELHGGRVGLMRNTTRGATMRLVIEQSRLD